MVVDKKKERVNSRMVRKKQSDGMVVEDRPNQVQQTTVSNEYDADLVDIILADPMRLHLTSSSPLTTTAAATIASTRRQRRLRSLYGTDYEATSRFLGSSSSGSSSAIHDNSPIIHKDGSSSGGGGGGGGVSPASLAIVFGFVIIGIVYLIYKAYSDHRKLEKHKLQRLKLRWDQISKIFQENNTRMVRAHGTVFVSLIRLLCWLVIRVLNRWVV